MHCGRAAGALREAALAFAGQIAARTRYVIRRAKESLNGIDPWDVNRSYRYEQGFTFELNLAGASRSRPGTSSSPALRERRQDDHDTSARIG